MNDVTTDPRFAVVSGVEYQALVLAHVASIGRQLPPLIWRVDLTAVSGRIVGRDDQDVMNRAKAWAEAFNTVPSASRKAVSATLVLISGDEVVISGRLGDAWREVKP
jgi:hypothetical protein